MDAADVFAGPIIRRAEPSYVTIWIALTKPFRVGATIRPVKADWTGSSDTSEGLQVLENLWIHVCIVRPYKDQFPTGTLLEYSVAVIDDDGNADHAPFRAIVGKDGLAYDGFEFPSFYLHTPDTALTVLYGSCRKAHGVKGGPQDALADGEGLVQRNAKAIPARPALLCLTGDQIYADDLHDQTFDAVIGLAAKLEGGKAEKLPGGGAPPGKGQREQLLVAKANFKKGHSANHVITFAEYVALYGLAWSHRNWDGITPGKDTTHYVLGTEKVRRLLANTPTYMIFDDHDVTDDWNINLQWWLDVRKTALGKRVVANALYAFWLFQGWGNNPLADAGQLPAILDANAKRLENSDLLAAAMSDRGLANMWEFATPTKPLIYFLDTRTQRGHVDVINKTNTGSPAALKSLPAWRRTLDKINKVYKRGTTNPLILVAPAPIFGFEVIDLLSDSSDQVLGPYEYDYEGWGANRGHLISFLLLCAANDVVVLSGDVHYAYTATAKWHVFDSPVLRESMKGAPAWPWPKKPAGDPAGATYDFLYATRFVQLTSSATSNYASSALAAASKFGTAGVVVDIDGRIHKGHFRSGKITAWVRTLLTPLVKTPVEYDLDEYKPIGALNQNVNAPHNAEYIGDHNVGVFSITGRRLENSFLVKGSRQTSHTFDFATEGAWPSP